MEIAVVTPAPLAKDGALVASTTRTSSRRMRQSKPVHARTALVSTGTLMTTTTSRA